MEAWVKRSVRRVEFCCTLFQQSTYINVTEEIVRNTWLGGGENEREIRGNEVGRGSDSSHNPRQLLGQKDLEKNGHADERKEERDTMRRNR